MAGEEFRLNSAEIETLIDRLERLGKRRHMEGIYTDEHIAAGAAEALRQLLDERTPKPIETAPRDGTELLLFSAWHQIVIARFEAGEWHYGLRGGETWPEDYPTHWLPLP